MSNYRDRRLTLDVPEVAALLGVGENQLYAACKVGASPIPCIRVGRRVVFARIVVERHLGPLDGSPAYGNGDAGGLLPRLGSAGVDHTLSQASPRPRWRCPAR